jgi:hypothetical protein
MANFGQGVCGLLHGTPGVRIAAVEADCLIGYSINLVGADQLAPSAPLTDPGQSDILQPSALIACWERPAALSTQAQASPLRNDQTVTAAAQVISPELGLLIEPDVAVALRMSAFDPTRT